MTTRKKLLIIIIAILVIGGSFGIKIFMDIQKEQTDLAALSINEVDMTQVADGSYTGNYDTTLIKVKVVVEVKNHKISDINLIQHDNGQGKPAEAIIPEVLSSQSLEVDSITGATGSSKAILKAIENAINQKT